MSKLPYPVRGLEAVDHLNCLGTVLGGQCAGAGARVRGGVSTDTPSGYVCRFISTQCARIVEGCQGGYTLYHKPCPFV